MAFDGASLRPLYRLDVGIPGASHALDVAGRIGMPLTVVERARELLGERDVRLERVIERVEVARREAEAGRRRVEQLELDARTNQRSIDEPRAEIELRHAWLEEEADALVDEQWRSIRIRLEEPLRRLSNAPRPFDADVRALQESIMEATVATPLHRRRMRFLAQVKKGDAVDPPRLGRRCSVRKVDRARQILSIEVGNMRLEVPFEDVSWIVPLDA